jgi:L-ascorbate metabolism protein UlaG (beta-lactamase superfamily)
MKNIGIKWLGHSTFAIDTPEDDTILVDPWLENNPECSAEDTQTESDLILATHGHPDHIGDVWTAFDNCSGEIVGIFELATWLTNQGLEPNSLVSMNKGGTVDFDYIDIEVTMTTAHHSSSYPQEEGILYLGDPAGYVVNFSNDETLYIAGDTSLFGDMKLIEKLHSPDAAILPIGDHFTMDPEAASFACEFLDVDEVIPCHWGTFDVLTGRPSHLEEHLQDRGVDTEVVGLEPGQRYEG